MPKGKHNNHARGAAHPRWSGGVTVSEHGYLKVQVGAEHPLADPNGFAYLHMLVWVSAGNARPTNGDNVHHKDDEKFNNRISNLERLSGAEHMKLHDQKRGRDLLGRFPKGE